MNIVIKQIFFIFFIFISLLGVFYYPDRFTDRFFTSGMIWMGLIMGMMGIFFSLIVRKPIRFSGFTLALLSGLAGIVIYSGITNNFSSQFLAWGIALVVFMVMLDSSAAWCSLRHVYVLLALLSVAEALIGIAQYLRLFGRYHATCPVTGTFENPAGFSAYLAICFPVVIYFISRPSLIWKIGGWVVASVLMLALVLSGARTGILAVGVLVVTGIWRYWEVGYRIPYWGKVSGIIAGVILLVALYLFKKDSADGRVLVWRTSLEMFGDAPLLGHGPGSFSAKYMDYQADWIVKHPGERWKWLADNVKHPFNEYLKIGVEYGVTGWMVIGLLIWRLVRSYRRSLPEEYPLYGGLLGLGICSLFSYPLNYPAIWVLALLLIGLIARKQVGSNVFGWLGRGIIASVAVGLTIFTVYWKKAEMEWYRIAHASLAGKTEEVLSDYRRLYGFMRQNPLFLYNYGAELHEIGYWEESIILLKECSRNLNDTDVQMLLADNYLQQEDFIRAEQHYWRAARMCPNRFLPLYQLVKLYERTGRNKEALDLVRLIVRKPVKVPSYTIKKIKEEMREILLKEKSA